MSLAVHMDTHAITESIELRWFFQGSLPPALLQRFKGFAAAGKFETLEESRSDYYLKNNRESVGIKLRKDGDEKDIELKFLKASARHDENDVSGQVERWRKWQFPASKFNFRNERAILESEWIAVSKVRYQIRVPATSSNSEKEGCDFELTSINSSRGWFWTIGFEAFSESGHEERNFQHALSITSRGFFSIDSGVGDTSDFKEAGDHQKRKQGLHQIRFSRDNSFSYPKFIRETLLK